MKSEDFALLPFVILVAVATGALFGILVTSHATRLDYERLIVDNPKQVELIKAGVLAERAESGSE